MSVTLHTSLGDLKVELYCDHVPKHVKNFLALCASNYYDNTTFHRNIPDFMIQGGDPLGTGRGGTSIWGTKFEDSFHPLLKHDKRGILAYANSGPDSNGSQFYITYKAVPELDGKYVVFGKVIGGFLTLDQMEKKEGDSNNRPLDKIHLRSVTIHSNPIALKSLQMLEKEKEKTKK
eukprot:gene571-8081_t